MPTSPPGRPRAVLRTLLCVLGLSFPAALLSAESSYAARSIEDYASYQPATTCSPRAKPGTKMLGHWLVETYGGGFGPISRACGGSTSEHTEGRAFDWTLDATTRRGQRLASRFLDDLRATNRRGTTDALARRMGVMYVIWDDHMYSAWRGFDRESYLSSSCTRRARCSKTLRHRDHLHVSITRRAARARTSWYVAQAPRRGR